ncbi:uncharacterized protein M437DRAFT_51403 [Aureobasidium melanogenum CBS 110374]|uniref:Uncharacterized protein n=1 Tax=Aureobasidium melanogenum (strain CBS 110374) TaxID=1043003 RepID=A0A074VQT7_AURM1|nr:uncharacterized protein M437DRAFT_51403 [Aureobasidium melanogenum CBS 110374]KEQ61549.1 hypothetical protein M437DRAFT_51403 [Aureobasidium melanogenum CBS 110374]
MTTPIRHAKGIARWRYISGGYNKYWYLRSALRWLTIAAAVTDLIVFAVLYSDWSEAYNVDTMYLGSVLFIVAPLLSFVTSAMAITLLFLLRRKVTINPGGLLSLDLVTGLLLVTDLVLNMQFSPNWPRGIFSRGEGVFRVLWCFCLILGVLHCILFLLEIWEVHVHRRMSREQRNLDSSNDVEAGDAGSKTESSEPDADSDAIELQDTASPAPAAVEVPNVPSHAEAPDTTSSPALPATILVELPDGRILELPEGSRVELPAEHRAELPDTSRKLRINTNDLDSASTASTEWYGSSPVAPSYRTQE